MIKLEHVVLASPEQMKFIIEGMHNLTNSWDKSDSGNGCDIGFCSGSCVFKPQWCGNTPRYVLGDSDRSLMQRLAKAGTDHREFMRMMPVYVRITAPLYWWKEFDTYKVGIVANSCSTMHKIQAKRFQCEDFSVEHILNCDEHHWMVCMDNIISAMNVMMNYEVLANIYKSHLGHKLDEWSDFCKWIEELPYSELITGGTNEKMA